MPSTWCEVLDNPPTITDLDAVCMSCGAKLSEGKILMLAAFCGHVAICDRCEKELTGFATRSRDVQCLVCAQEVDFFVPVRLLHPRGTIWDTVRPEGGRLESAPAAAEDAGEVAGSTEEQVDTVEEEEVEVEELPEEQPPPPPRSVAKSKKRRRH